MLGLHFDELSVEQREAVLAAHPRTGFKEGIVEAFSAGMRDKPGCLEDVRVHRPERRLGVCAAELLRLHPHLSLRELINEA